MKSTLQGSVAQLGKQLLAGSPYRDVREISCEFTGGVLTLRGSVDSFFHKQVAQQSVRGLTGVQRIDNQIEVTARSR